MFGFCGHQVEDANAGYMYGLQTLFRYYSYGLEADWHAGRFRDFQHAVLQDLARESTYGLEKVCACVCMRESERECAHCLLCLSGLCVCEELWYVCVCVCVCV